MARFRESNSQPQAVAPVEEGRQAPVGLEPPAIETLKVSDGTPRRLAPGRTIHVPALDDTPDSWPCSFDRASFAGRALLANSANPPVWAVADGSVMRFRLRHWIVRPMTGLNPATRIEGKYLAVVLLNEAGESVHFAADWAVRRLEEMLKLFTPAEWSAGIVIECYPGTSRDQGKTYGSFRIAPNQEM